MKSVKYLLILSVSVSYDHTFYSRKLPDNIDFIQIWFQIDFKINKNMVVYLWVLITDGMDHTHTYVKHYSLVLERKPQLTKTHLLIIISTISRALLYSFYTILLTSAQFILKYSSILNKGTPHYSLLEGTCKSTYFLESDIFIVFLCTPHQI